MGILVQRFAVLAFRTIVFGLSSLLAVSVSLGLEADKPLEEMSESEIAAFQNKLCELRDNNEISVSELLIWEARIGRLAKPILEPSLSEDEQTLLSTLQLLLNTDKAAALANLELEITESSSPAMDFLAGNLYAELENFEEAVLRYETAIQKLPDYYRALKNCGTVLIKLENWNMAKSRLLKAYSLKEEKTEEVSGMLGFCYLGLEEWPTAEHYFREAIRIANRTRWQSGLAIALSSQGRHEEALPILEEIYAIERAAESAAAKEQALELENVDAYPEARDVDLGIEGDAERYVVVEFVVRSTGKVRDVVIVESSDDEIAEKAKLALYRSIWTPAKKDAKPVDVKVRQRFEFGVSE